MSTLSCKCAFWRKLSPKAISSLQLTSLQSVLRHPCKVCSCELPIVEAQILGAAAFCNSEPAPKIRHSENPKCPWDQNCRMGKKANGKCETRSHGSTVFCKPIKFEDFPKQSATQCSWVEEASKSRRVMCGQDRFRKAKKYIS